MTNYKYVLGLDPSGSFHEGNGTTGWCLFDATTNEIIDRGNLDAENYEEMEAYWDAHISLIRDKTILCDKNVIIVIEDYILYAAKLDSQINSRMETPKLIGILQHYCWLADIPYYMQLASEVKNRWTNEILLHKKIIYKNRAKFYIDAACTVLINRHCIDAIRHAVHYNTFRNKKEGNKNVRKG